MSVIKSAAMSAALGVMTILAVPQTAQARDCHTIEICIDLIFVSGCYTWESCGGGDGGEESQGTD